MSYAATFPDTPLSKYLARKIPPVVPTAMAGLAAYGIATVFDPRIHFDAAPPIAAVTPSPLATPIPDLTPSPIPVEPAATPAVKSIQEPVRVRPIVPRAEHALVRPLHHQRVVSRECVCRHKSRHVLRASSPVQVEAQKTTERRQLTLLDAIANMFGPRIDP
jgi:hypothetical protein